MAQPRGFPLSLLPGSIRCPVWEIQDQSADLPGMTLERGMVRVEEMNVRSGSEPDAQNSLSGSDRVDRVGR
jgi:hypothetical protein